MDSVKRLGVILSVLIAGLSGALAAPADKKPANTSPPKCYYIRHFSTRTHHYYYKKVCRQQETFDHRLNDFLQSLTDEESSALQKRLEAEKKVQRSRFALAMFEPTYILPFYYTGSPYQAPYQGTTPENQKIMHEEFKAQMSFQLQLWRRMFGSPVDLNVSYTQLSYWQFYAKSQFFRETDYEPALFISDHFSPNWLGYLGAVHQSNGRGGRLERSWNRLYIDLMASGEHWMVSVKPWILVFKAESSNLHNPDIYRYLGYGRIVVAFTFYHQELTFKFRNIFASGFKRGAIEVGYSFPIFRKVKGFVQFFSGYGQSLIEYNHYTNSAGVGVMLSNWI